MCRTLINGQPGTGRRCPSCQDKEKRSAYDRARYQENKHKKSLTNNTSPSEELAFNEEPTFSHSSQFTNMPQTQELVNVLDVLEAAIIDESTDRPNDMAYFNVDPDGEISSNLYGGDIPPAESDSLILEVARKVKNGFNASITLPNQKVAEVKVFTVVFSPEVVKVQGDIFIDGVKAGVWNRSIVLEESDYHAEYSSLKIKPEYQKMKLGTQLIKHFDSVMLATGITKVKMVANVDVGGYAWAKHGYDWDRDFTSDKAVTWIIDGFERELRKNPQLSEKINGLLTQLKQPFHANYPTPLDVAMFDYENKDENGLWLGKRVMLRSLWAAERNLI
jgi:GNAT superfamily N-acetyltransferase